MSIVVNCLRSCSAKRLIRISSRSMRLCSRFVVAAMASLLLAIQDGFERGDDRLDFGGGDHPYKLRFTDGTGDDALTWTGLFPFGPRYPLTRAQLAPGLLRGVAVRRARALPPERREQIKRALRRG